MTIIKTMLGTGAALAAIAAVPASAQSYGYSNYGYSQPRVVYSQPTYGYAQPNYGYSQRYTQPYGYSQSYGYAQPYGYSQQPYGAYAANTNMATQQCSAAVQNRLANRTSLGGILGAVLGVNTSGRIVAFTQVAPRYNGSTTVRGLASSGRYASNGYGPYGVGAYGALGYGTQAAADLSFRCDVDYRGYVRNVSINRR
jgi:hypothetical protein